MTEFRSTVKQLPLANACFATSLDYGDYPDWAQRARPVRTKRGQWSAVRQLHHAARCVRVALQCRHSLLLSSTGSLQPELVAALVLGMLPLRYRPVTVLLGCMWEPDAGPAGWVQQLVVHLADRGVDLYAVQSQEELLIFSQTWDISVDKVRAVPYFATLDAEELCVAPPCRPPYIFAGGNSHRTYDNLLTAAREFPAYEFVLATDVLQHRRDIPSNVQAGPVPHNEFVGLMRGAAAVVVPLSPGLRRAAGQQTYLNAMLLKRPTVITASTGVLDYVRDGVDAMVVDGSAESYRMVLAWILDPDQAIQVGKLAEAGARTARRFSFERHAQAVLSVLDEATRTRLRLTSAAKRHR